jgi:hypothetical protein
MDNIAHKYYDAFTDDSTNLITFARGIFQPFKEIYGFKRTEGILWWKKVIWEDLKIEYKHISLGTIRVTVKFEKRDYCNDYIEYRYVFTRKELELIRDKGSHGIGRDLLFGFFLIGEKYKRASGF